MRNIQQRREHTTERRRVIIAGFKREHEQGQFGMLVGVDNFRIRVRSSAVQSTARRVASGTTEKRHSARCFLDWKPSELDN